MNTLANTISKLGLFGAALVLSVSSIAGEAIDKTLSTNSDGRVSIDVLSGYVNIESWDKNEVRVVGELDDQAEGYQFEGDDGRVVFKVHMPNQRWGNWKESNAELTFYVPKQNDVRFEGVNVSVQIAGVLGGSRINTVNGNIKAENLTKRVNLETVNGNINSKNLEGRIHLVTVNGKIHDQNSKGELKVEAVNGDIETSTSAKEVSINNVNGDMELNLSHVQDVEISTVNGDMEIDYTNDGKGKVFISTVGGEIDLNVAADISASFNVEAHSGGDITNKLTSQRAKKERYGPGESLRFETGNGKIEFVLDTVNGDINILKKRK